MNDGSPPPFPTTPLPHNGGGFSLTSISTEDVPLPPFFDVDLERTLGLPGIDPRTPMHPISHLYLIYPTWSHRIFWAFGEPREDEEVLAYAEVEHDETFETRDL